ncbi:acetoacetate--CoA ligase [Nocardioides sp. DS6]|uniref:Acetoacetate--CoA ligase n=1 Tax=Nocardioides eburneus TaxID=3231482 RepID=A0ABV3T1J1_9ACTN
MTTHTTAAMREPELLYEPSPQMYDGARVWRYLDWLREHRGVDLAGWDELYAWSVEHLEDFWGSLWDYFGIISHAEDGYTRVLSERTMPGARWFEGALVNYAEHALRHADTRPDDSAVVAYSQTRDTIELTFAQLADDVRRARAGLQRLGVARGDRVAAYLPNIPETLVAYLATASLGAVWSSCAPEFGARSVVDRFGQIEPKVLLAVAGYTFGAKEVDKRADVAAVRAGLPTVEHVVHVPYGPLDLDLDEEVVTWRDLTAETDAPMAYEPVPFDHPLTILYSSGTTGLPKAIVHGHGGLMLEHLKCQTFHWDLGPGDRLLWFSTTAWMLWTALVSGLVTGASIVLTDGNPLYPDLRAQWRMAAESGAAKMGANPAFLMACRKEGVRPDEEFDLSRLRQIGVAGSPLPPEGARWLAEQFGNRVLVNNGVGGTDVCTGIVHGSPLQPVWAGEMSGPTLGVDVKAYDEDGHPVTGVLGELVIRTPMPSMPVAFWGDPDGRRLRAAYFDTYPGVFRFGDWCRFSEVGSCLVTGRSDATLNRGGVRLGTAEYYRVLQDLPEVTDSVVVHLEDPAGGLGELLLFVVPADGVHVDDALRAKLAATVRGALSPRHVPDRIIEVPAVPYSRTGKKLEVPVKKILRGADPTSVASPGALVDAGALDAYVDFARSLGGDS